MSEGLTEKKKRLQRSLKRFWGCINNTSFSSQLMNGLVKQDFYILLS
jgi:hypothetical protein